MRQGAVGECDPVSLGGALLSEGSAADDSFPRTFYRRIAQNAAVLPIAAPL
jgi:hypothetical protein